MNIIKPYKIYIGIMAIIGIIILIAACLSTPNTFDGIAHSIGNKTITYHPDHSLKHLKPTDSVNKPIHIPSIAFINLPKEAQNTIYLIQSNGPFPYPQKDGRIFSNREQKLPLQFKGYYTEYTVKTPGLNHRGTRRIIAGQGHTNNPANSGEYFYTDDHYSSFKYIDLHSINTY